MERGTQSPKFFLVRELIACYRSAILLKSGSFMMLYKKSFFPTPFSKISIHPLTLAVSYCTLFEHISLSLIMVKTTKLLAN